jgi:hypothetical protein
MSFVLLNRIDLIQGQVLNVYDSTGLYNLTTNPTAWGSPNPTRAGITSATVKIYLPDEDDPIVTTTVTATVQAGGSTVDMLLYSYLPSDFGLSDDDPLPDGIYRMVYTVVSGGTTYTSDQYFLNYYTVKCCVFNKFANFVNETCGCKDSSELLTQWITLKALMFAVAGGNLTEANTMLTKLQRMCEVNRCC